MRILLVVPKFGSTDRPYYAYTFPIGLAYISSALKQAGYTVDCVNLNHEPGRTQTILDRVLRGTRYDFVCSGGPCIYYDSLRAVVEAVRSQTPAPRVVLGGTTITSEPELMFASLAPDVAVVGEGEVTIVELLQCMTQHGDLNTVDGIVYNDGGRIVATRPRSVTEDLGRIPYPDSEGLGFGTQLANTHCNDNYVYSVFDYPRPYPLLGSRGCPYNCTFCWHPEKYRARSVDNIMGELRAAVEKYRINFINLYDDCFSVKGDRLTEFCHAMRELRKHTSWDLRWSCQLLVNIVDRGMLKTLKEAGCSSISYGFESYSAKVLRSMKKPITPEQIDRAFTLTRDMGITIQANFIFGDVAETMETACETLDYWKKHCQSQVTLAFVNPYPGSQIYQHCLDRGLIRDKLDFIRTKIASSQYNHFNMTDAMTDNEIERLYVLIQDLRSQYIPYVRPRRMVAAGRPSIYRMEIVCPFCLQDSLYENVYIGNKLAYGMAFVCRHCAMKIFVVGILQSLARYRLPYRVLRRIRQVHLDTMRRVARRTARRQKNSRD